MLPAASVSALVVAVLGVQGKYVKFLNFAAKALFYC